MIVKQSLQAHSLIFASNTPAFMQGGEELFRTKELQWDPNNPTTEYQKSFTIKPSDCAPMYGHWICHNSYNTPISVNAFNWNNKKSFTISYNNLSTSIDAAHWNGEQKCGLTGLTGVFADMIKLHKESAKKRTDSATEWSDVFGATSKGNPANPNYPNVDPNSVNNTFWGDANVYGMQINEVFVYVSLNGSGDVPIDKQALSSGHWNRYVKCGYVGTPYDAGVDARLPLTEKNSTAVYYADGWRQL